MREEGGARAAARFLARYDEELRHRLTPPPGMRREDDGPLTRIVGPTANPLDHMVCHSRLSARDADAVVRVEVERARRAGHGLQWNVYEHDEPRDLAERLARHGLSVQARETVMSVASDDPRLVAPARPDLEVRRIEREDALGDFIRVDEAVWGTQFTEWTQRWFRAALRGDADPVGIFVAWVHGVPAGAAWIALPSARSIASLFGGTVLPAYRRRGVYRALVGARARLARESEFPTIVADANEHSAPRLFKLGFVPFASRTEMVLAAPK